MENVFDALCSALNELQIKTLFLSAEGPDLMVLMTKFVFLMLCPAFDA
jgi:beta-catenin-like protein 1